MVITFILMRNIETYDGLATWILTSLGVVLVFIMLLDTFMLMIFAAVFKSSEDISTSCLAISSLILVGSPDLRAR